MTNKPIEPDQIPDPSDESTIESLPTPLPASTREEGNRIEPAPDIGSNAGDEPLERGMPDLNQRSRRRAWWLTPLAIGMVVIVGAVWTVHGFIVRHDADAKARRDSAAEQPAQGRQFGDTAPASAVGASGTPASAPIAVTKTPTPSRVPATPIRSYYDAPLLAGSTSAESGAPSVLPTTLSALRSLSDAAASSVGTAGQTLGSLAQALMPSATPRVMAAQLGDRNFILAQGAKIDCVGDTAFDSTEAGMTTCTVTQNVYSDNGHVVLIERGSQVNSEYRANMAQGQRRVFILSARIKTPNGITVEIDSPVADALGRMGVGGYVNNHWGERIGAAFMLSLVQDSIGYLSTRGGNGNSSVTFQNTQQTGNDMASRVLDSTINIPPTLTQNQGAEFTIVVARDLDFSSVYALESVATRATP